MRKSVNLLNESDTATLNKDMNLIAQSRRERIAVTLCHFLYMDIIFYEYFIEYIGNSEGSVQFVCI